MNPIDELLGNDDSAMEMMNLRDSRGLRTPARVPSATNYEPVDDFAMPGLEDESRDRIRSRDLGPGFDDVDDLSELQSSNNELPPSRDVVFQANANRSLSTRSPNGGSVEFADLADPAGRSR